MTLVDQDSNVIVIGGFSNAAMVEKFDRTTETWSTIGTLKEGRRQHTAFFIDNNRILVVGGRYPGVSTTASAEIFDIRSGTSEYTTSFDWATSSCQTVTYSDAPFATAVVGGRDGGPNSFRTAEINSFDIENRRWNVAATLSHPTVMPKCISLWGGGALVAGGATAESPYRSATSVWKRESGTTQFPKIGEMVDGRQHHGIAQISDGYAIVGGGYKPNAVISSTCDLINLNTNSVEPGPTMSERRTHVSFISIPSSYAGNTPIAGTVLAIGGVRDDDRGSTLIEILTTGCTSNYKNLLTTIGALKTVGVAQNMFNSVVLTSTEPLQAGAVWMRGKVNLTSGFSTSFSYRITQGSDNSFYDGGSPGGDGIAFVLQNSEPAPLGLVGQGIGYEDIQNGIAIEFDSYLNSANGDPDGSHIAVQAAKDGALKPWHQAPYLQAITQNIHPFIADDRTYYVRIDVTDVGIDVYYDASGHFGAPVLTLPYAKIGDLISLDSDGSAWIGITSATSYSVEQHEVLSWSIDACHSMLPETEEAASQGVTTAPQVIAGLNVNAGPQIYPMPSRDNANLKWSSAKTSANVMVLDASGRRIWSEVVTAGQLSAGMPLPIQSIAPGFYMVRIVTDDAAHSVAWIVQK